jgi:diguanylate cyclase (GGDEF)-like protein
VTSSKDKSPAGSEHEVAFQNALLDAMDGPTAILDQSGVVIDANEALEALLSKHESKIIGSNIADFFNSCDELGVSLDALIPALLRVRLGDHEPEFDMSLSLVFDDQDKPQGWIVRVSSPNDGDDPNLRESLDTLTNLPDHAFMRAKLNALLVDQSNGPAMVTVLCLDLDGFDQINRDYGRAIGDQVLIETGVRLGRSMRASNTVGRLVEDSFLVLVPDMRSEEQITSVATRIITHVSRPFSVKGSREPISLTASVGIAECDEAGMTADQLISNARAAVDLAKRTGAGTYQFYTNATGGEIRERRSRVSNLRRAIDLGQFELVYQPKMSLVTNRIVGAEALVRWQHPESGTIMPGEFIPLAEDAGLIDPLGAQILNTACGMLSDWHARGLDYMRIAVNVSAKEVARASFYDDLCASIKAADIPPEMLELELTESAIMEGAEDIIQSLHKIRGLGVHLTADDFGTGYASLSYLKNFPLDGLKIDTSFVAEIENPEEGGGLAAAVIAVGHSLGMSVVAEGVETQHQLNYLRWRECDQVQGFLVSEPLAADAFEALVRGESRS